MYNMLIVKGLKSILHRETRREHAYSVSRNLSRRTSCRHRCQNTGSYVANRMGGAGGGRWKNVITETRDRTGRVRRRPEREAVGGPVQGETSPLRTFYENRPFGVGAVTVLVYATYRAGSIFPRTESLKDVFTINPTTAVRPCCSYTLRRNNSFTWPCVSGTTTGKYAGGPARGL